jgi:hypothetical protein
MPYDVIQLKIIFLLSEYPGQLMGTSINSIGPEINDHISLQ